MNKLITPIIAAASIVAAFLFFQFITTPAVKVRSALSKSEAFVGDRLKFAVIADSRKDIDIDIPDLDQALSKFKIIDSGYFQKESMTRRRSVKWHIIAGYETGQYVIPKVAIKYTAPDGSSAGLETGELLLTINSVLDKETTYTYKTKIGGGLAARGAPGEKEAAREIEGLIKFKIIDDSSPAGIITYTDIGIIAAVILVAIALSLSVFRFIRAVRNRPRKISAYDLAVQNLGDLGPKISSGKISPKEFCFELSAVLRTYLKSALDLGADELTTKEFIGTLEASSMVTQEEKKIIKEIVTLCDLVKFSGYVPKAAEIDLNLAGAKRMVSEIETALQNRKG